MTNHEKRVQAIQTRLIDKQVVVGRLGEFDPRRENFDGVYVPLPEYGIYLRYDNLKDDGVPKS
jgi:hypothetical protein